MLLKCQCHEYDWQRNEIGFTSGYIRSENIEGLQTSYSQGPNGEALTDLWLVGRDTVVTVLGDADKIATVLVTCQDGGGIVEFPGAQAC